MSFSILKKLMKISFHLQDNLLSRRLQAQIDGLEFAKRRMVHSQIQDIVDLFVETFHYSSRDSELAHLDRSHNPMRTKDAVVLMYFAGLLTIIIFLVFVVWALPL